MAQSCFLTHCASFGCRFFQHILDHIQVPKFLTNIVKAPGLQHSKAEKLLIMLIVIPVHPFSGELPK